MSRNAVLYSRLKQSGVPRRPVWGVFAVRWEFIGTQLRSVDDQPMDDQLNSSRRVVFSGLGIVSPIGLSIDAFWDSLAAGRSGIGRVEGLPFIGSPDCVAGEVKEFTESAARKVHLKKHRKSIKVMCREIQLGVASAMQALEQSALDMEQVDHERLGVDFGANLMFSPPSVLLDACRMSLVENQPTSEFDFDRWGREGINGMEPLWLLRYLPNMPACHIGIAADARGPNNSITMDEASANLVLAEAGAIIKRGRADAMIAGTTGTRLHPVKSMHAKMWDQLADRPDAIEQRCRPFDLDRSGQAVGEGACSFLLEDETHARARGADIFGVLLGAGSSCVQNASGDPDCGQALVNAMHVALANADLQPSDIGHVNANGLATTEADKVEARALREVFGDNGPPVTALKSYLGNSGSGCGTLELAASLLGLRRGLVPATLNYDTPDPECPVNVVHGQPAETTNPVVLNVNVTRSGQASVLIAGAA